MSQGGFRSRSRSAGKTNPDKAAGRGPETQRKYGQRNRSQVNNRPGGRVSESRGRQGDFRKLSGVDIARSLAFHVLHRVSSEDAFANLVLPKLLNKANVHGRDAAFATELTYGTLRTLGVLDTLLAECSSRGLETIHPELLDALRLGAYQLMYMRVEPHAAVDTTVRIVEALGHDKAKGFANGILRTISRSTPAEWTERLAPQGEVANIAFRTAHPEWIAHSFSRVVGLSNLEDALRADSDRPIVHLVARPGEISSLELSLITGGEQGKYSPYAVYLGSGDPGELEPVQQQLAAVQDEGSQLIARALTEASVDGTDTGRWLDLCAGPGGKAALLGALARIDAAHVDAIEVSEHRARLIEKTVAGLPVRVKIADGRRPGLDNGYDRVLVDAPCSGLGALRRRPDARWRKRESDIAELVPLQRELLASACELVRPGGVVVYSTCSPDLRETREIVDYALSNLGMVEEDAATLVPEMSDTGEYKSVQMWPHQHGTDAMFFAVLKKPRA
ncbi:Ribosomal RNA small subunit methyltransferase B [Corynebacterium pseudotuberculosis]|uniref:RsmB/NOP family class I SAM-dependent RNA methyltransferase n=1 Tax=Corynebacterium pseudotuberculosis TaxID=1719 RepID=UPI00065E9612|nr:transcription antitermination factor NusB [Corynebacterium pseudotuberculosis]AKP08779.1 Ribosomal RNA small subunit methyltransferase B [Corynebacterium pseudotuberculosis]